MNVSRNYNNHYYIGGSLPANAPSYVERQADYELYEAITRGDFCYVLNSRQMGKSSLRVKVQQRLQKESLRLESDASKYICISVEVNSFGTQISEDRWYYSFIDRLLEYISDVQDFDLLSWWQDQAQLSPVRKLGKFIDYILLHKLKTKIVIFLDEIDTFISLSFNTDDFFAFIRDCYNQRAENTEYHRLSFVLVGVSTPSALMKDRSRTPFNIGRPIELIGFDMSEVKPLILGLTHIADRPKVVTEKIIGWTSGQPFLTQKLCNLLVKRGLRVPVGEESSVVDDIVVNEIIESWEYHDEPVHLRVIRDRLLNEADAANRVLWLYKEILGKGKILSNPENNEKFEQILRLSGLIVKKPVADTKQRSNLVIYNNIYKRIFNQEWLDNTLSQIRPYNLKIQRWLASEKKENQFLLTKEEYNKVESWIKGKALGDDDHSFIQESFVRINEEVHALKLKNGNIVNLEELVTYSDKFPEEILHFLFNKRLGGWLFDKLGETGLADYTTVICSQYSHDEEKNKGLELFVREVAKKVGMHPSSPKISVSPSAIDMGIIYFGEVSWVALKITQTGRGKIWGEIQYDSTLQGISIKKKLDYNQSEVIISVDTKRATQGNYTGNLYVKIDGTGQTVLVKLSYVILHAEETVSVREIKFGKVLSNEAFRAHSFSIQSSLDTAKLILEYSRDYNDYIQLKIAPESYYEQAGRIVSKNSRLDVCLKLCPQKIRNFTGNDEKFMFKLNEKSYSIKLNFNLVKIEDVITRTAAILSFIGFVVFWMLRRLFGVVITALPPLNQSEVTYDPNKWIVNLNAVDNFVFSQPLFSQAIRGSDLPKISLSVLALLLFCLAGAYLLGTNRDRGVNTVDFRSFRFFFFLLIGVVLFYALMFFAPYILILISYIFLALFVAVERVADQPNEWLVWLKSSGSNVGGVSRAISPFIGWGGLGAVLGCSLGTALGLLSVKERQSAVVVLCLSLTCLCVITLIYFPYQLFF